MPLEKSDQFIIKMAGGLGNQLFQYAFGRAISIAHGAKLLLDVSAFANDRFQRCFRLDYFCIPSLTFANKAEVRYYQKFKRRIGREWYIYNKIFADKSKYFTEKQFHFDPEAIRIRPSAFFEGYWQTDKYFQAIASTIRQELVPSGESSDYFRKNIYLIQNAQTPVSLHIRRGDYEADPISKKYHGGICTKAYYDRAIEEMLIRVNQPSFFVFSDDIGWAKSNVRLPSQTIFVSEHTSHEGDDLMLMSACKHHIMSNSSFSWWGVWLNARVDKTVIAPYRWMNKDTLDTHDLLPDSWLRIDC